MAKGNLLRGTTPNVIFKFKKDSLDVSEIEAIELTIVQGNTKYIKDLSQVTVDSEDNSVRYHFTEAETLSFKAKVPVDVQMRFKIGFEIVGTGNVSLIFGELESNKAFDDE